MAICPQCGRKFSSFSFGSNPATECSDCRKARARAAELAGSTAMAPPAETSGGNKFKPTVTLTLVFLNVLIYVAMGLSGVSWTQPSIEHAIRWGADFGPLTLSGEWWRLLTSTFIHFGIIHIAFNMWCLWDLGRALELFMGRKAFTVTYLLSGLMASLVSVAWNPWRVSAGASGAIFGVAGAFVSFLYLKKTTIDAAVVRQKLKSLAIFIGYNLLRGAGGGIDNSAHIGGLVAGLILGALVPAMLRSGDAANPLAEPSVANPIEAASAQESYAHRIAWQIPLGGMVVLLIAAGWIHTKNLPAAHYGKAVESVEAGQLSLGIAEMQQTVALDPSLILANMQLGEWRLEQGDPAAAIPVFEHALSLVPGAYDIEHNLALAYLGSGRPTDAMREITRALQYEKTNAWRAQCIFGLAAEQAGNSRLASENFRSVIQAKPDFQEARDALARIESASSRGNAVTIPYAKLALKSEAWPLYP
jgi:membrane associated rhomboid family serine protease/cytochrome c-type biogenesis protein CcmH/NrfG